MTLSFAVSDDLCLSATRGERTRISGDAALQVTHQLRAAHDALLIGVGTVLTDDPLLTTRLGRGPSPRRVVLDSRLRTPVEAQLLGSTPQSALLLTTTTASEARERALVRANAEVVRVRGCETGLALPAALGALHRRGVSSVMVEGGAAVLESFFRARLVDFLAVTFSPRQLASAASVGLGPAARAALAAWDVPVEHLGGDTLRSGPAPRALKVAL